MYKNAGWPIMIEPKSGKRAIEIVNRKGTELQDEHHVCTQSVYKNRFLQFYTEITWLTLIS